MPPPATEHHCARCGTPIERRGQCPACGALDTGEGELTLDLAEPAASGAPLPPRFSDDPAASAPTPPRSQTWAGERRASAALFWRATRIPVLLILGWFTISHLALGSVWVFIDNVNVLLHEGGHVLFGWGSKPVAALGGTIGQLIWPALFAVYFLLWRKQRFAGVACLWWLGENLIGIARYMKDAPREELPLIGGDVHDWAFLFRRWDLLSKSDEIAAAVRMVGAGAMVVTLVALLWWTIRPSPDELATSYSSN